jgi:hypothetical protein
MPEPKANKRSAAPDARESVAAYASSWEHFADELERLDLRIRILLEKQQRNMSPDVLGQFKGLVISDQEVGSLLAETLRERTNHTSNTYEHHPLRIALKDLDDRIRLRRRSSQESAGRLSLPILSQSFGLTPFEEQCIVACLAPELDRRYEKLYAYLQDDATRRKPSVALLLDLFCGSIDEKIKARPVFDRRAPLMKYGLLRIVETPAGGQSSLLAQSLKLDDRIVNFLFDIKQADERLDSIARMITPNSKADVALVCRELHERIVRFIRTQVAPSPLERHAVFHLHNSDGVTRRALAAAVTCEFDLPLLIGDVEQMAGRADFDELLRLFALESTLQPAILCFDNLDCLLSDPEKSRSQIKSLLDAVRSSSRVVFFSSNRDWQPRDLLYGELFIAIDVAREDSRSAEMLWRIGGKHLRGERRFAPDVDWEGLASKFRLTPGQISGALVAAETLSRWRQPEGGELTTADLHQACRAQSMPKLKELARKIEPKYEWVDII